MAETIILTNRERERLSEYEDILSQKSFNGKKNIFVGHETTENLAIIYKDITGLDVECTGGCDDKSFIKRLSNWYFGNRFGLKEGMDELKKRGRKPKQLKK